MGKDPAFLFYPGDAAEDVSHMNRLERGCYFDFVQAQKKFGPLPLATIKKILGKDFETCWESLKMCLTYEKDMYFIAWLKDSIEKRQKYSASRSKNRKGQIQLENKENAKTYVNHMEIGNEIENSIKGAFDNLYLDQQKMQWSHIDFDFEYETFCNKVRGSPRHYKGRDSDSLRLAFQSQLRSAKSKPKPAKVEVNKYETAEFNKGLWTLEAWEKEYNWALKRDPEFRKYFGYDEQLRISKTMGGNGQS